MNIVSAEDNALLERLKTEFADSAARSDIETIYDRDTEGWYFRSPALSVSEGRIAGRAMLYLTLRGLIEQHPADNEFVRFKQ